MAKVKLAHEDYKPGEKIIYFKCPGCHDQHTIPTEGPKKWQFNNDFNNPTLSPSIHYSTPKWVDPENENYVIPATCCHFFIRSGKIEFCSDCTHDLKGKTVDLAEIE